MSKWTADDIPDQRDRVAVVTGGNSGLGLISVRELARHGAHVVLACRSIEKGEAARREIEEDVGTVEVDVRSLDLASLESVQSFVEELPHDRLDLLMNNAGVMMNPPRKTEEGFELQLGTNHLGHFALTGLLLDKLERADAARVVTLSSVEHKAGHLDFDDLQRERSYNARSAYQQSKLANAAFGVELDRRLRAKGASTISVLAHPGYSATNLQLAGPTGALKAFLRVGNALLAQSAEQGAMPQLYAAAAPDVKGGEYYGPDGLREMRGHPTPVEVIAEGRDPVVGRRLWEVSEDLTGVRYGLPEVPL